MPKKKNDYPAIFNKPINLAIIPDIKKYTYATEKEAIGHISKELSDHRKVLLEELKKQRIEKLYSLLEFYKLPDNRDGWQTLSFILVVDNLKGFWLKDPPKTKKKWNDIRLFQLYYAIEKLKPIIAIKENKKNMTYLAICKKIVDKKYINELEENIKKSDEKSKKEFLLNIQFLKKEGFLKIFEDQTVKIVYENYIKSKNTFFVKEYKKKIRFYKDKSIKKSPDYKDTIHQMRKSGIISSPFDSLSN